MNQVVRMAAALLLLATPAHAAPKTPAWAQFGKPEAVAIVGYAGDAMEPFVSRDGRVLYFNNRNDPPEQTDLHWAERIDDHAFRYRGLLIGANSSDLDGVPTQARNGRFCFVSSRDYWQTLAMVRCGMARGGTITDLMLERGASVGKLGRVVFDVEISADGDRLILADGEFRGGPLPASADLRQARREADGFRLAPADDPLFAAINTPALEYAAALSSDGLELAFTRMEGKLPFVKFSSWIARRPSSDQPFGAPVRLASIRGHAEAPTFSPGDGALYFHRKGGKRFTIWRITRARP